ncbi:MAG: fused MFS/spermidine synthase, partial [Deltaproteobacteria bacterium]|nr:fused MFS/spermidine synthase [Deltaproteobacteria bacterium]
TVLATFMAGLALGSWLGGRLADRLPREPGAGTWRRLVTTPIFYYAGCEALVGAFALLVPALVGAYRPLNATLWAHLGDSPVLLATARFGLTAVVLMIPTTAMGATLPLLGRQVTRSGKDFEALSRRLGILYAANTAGAVLGAASAGFLFIPLLGAHSTNLLAAASAAGLATAIVLALVVRGNRPRKATLDEQAEALEEPADSIPAPSTAHRRLALIAYAVSGATAMALEVLWSRALAVVIGSSVYSFTLILVVFLVGLSVGSAAFARRAQRTRDPFGLLAWIFAATGLAIVLTHLVIDDLPTMFLALVEGGTMSPGSILSVHSILAGLVILPAAIGLGAVMPVAMRAYVGGVDAVGRDVGRAYASNTVGAILGSLLGGILIMPVLGIERGVLLCALIYALCAAALAQPAPVGRRRLVSGLAIAIALGCLVAPGWNRSDFTAGLFRTHLARHYLSEGGLFERNVVYYADGIATTVSVERSESQWTLKNNGKTEASNKTDMPTQILVGLLPVMLHPGDIKDVFVVGYGSGVTIGGITQSPSVKRVDVVELEPRVLEAADRYFSDFNNRPQDDPKVHRYIGDGRDVLLARRRTYDVIVSEPSNPWMAGVSSLFTREFYAFAKEHLATGGVFCQWAQLYELGPRNVKMIYATFSEAFPYVYAFTPGDATSDTILIGTLEPLEIDLDRLAAKMRDPVLRAELIRAEVDLPEQLIASFFLGPEDIASFTAGADINTDDNARLEFAAPLDLLSENRARLAREIRTMDWPYGRLEGIVSLGSDPGRRANLLARELVGYGRYREANHWLEVARDHGAGAEANITARLIELAMPVDYLDPELPLTAGGAPLPDLAPSLFKGTGRQRQNGVNKLRAAYEHLAVGEWALAHRALSELPPRAESETGRDVELVRGYLAYKSVNLRKARSILRKLASEEIFRRRPAARYYLGRALLGLGNFAEGRDVMIEFIRRHPDLAKQAAKSRL